MKRVVGGREWLGWPRIAAVLVCSLMSTEVAFAQQLGRGVDDGISTWRVIAALAVCAAVALGAALVMKRRMIGGTALFRGNRGSARLTMVESLRLRPQIDLCIVSCDGDELLIMLSPQGANLLRPLSHRDAQAGHAGGA
jgi:hypothetical protein